MLRPKHPSRRRSGAAAVEFAFVVTFVLSPTLVGIWEMGRAIQVQQIVANAAREGARLAAQGRTINQNGTQTQIVTTIDPPNASNLPNIKAAVYQTLYGAGLKNLTWNTSGNAALDDFTVTFAFLPPQAGDSPLIGAVAGATEPWQGVKNQRFQVTVTLTQRGWQKCRWINLGIVNPTSLTYTAEWRTMADDPFTVNTNMPTW
jgi:Flp pilus assembly protein TadG